MFNSFAFAKSSIEAALLKRAAKGDNKVAQSILEYLKRFPALAPGLRDLDDLMTKSENAWIKAVTFGNTLAVCL
jgi:hypothetical protein